MSTFFKFMGMFFKRGKIVFIPLVLSIMLLGAIAVIGKSQIIAPFLYTLF